MMKMSKTAFAIRIFYPTVTGCLLTEPFISPDSLAIAAQQHHLYSQEQYTMKLRLLFDAGAVSSDWFSPDFLKQVSPAQVEQNITLLKEQFGDLKNTEVTEGKGFLQFEKARVPVLIGFDGASRINILWFGAPWLENTSLEDLTGKLKNAATGDISVFVTINGKSVIDDKSQRAMAVGSAFKLVVLKAYEDALASGELRREQVVTFEASDRSLPSGTLQVVSTGTPLTLEMLAQLMVKISDNTATDTLIRILGKERLEALSPGNVPFLKTRELFQLIAPGAEATRTRYRAAGPQERRQILSDLKEQPLPRTDQTGRIATWQNVEWYLTAREICGLLRSVKEAPALDSSSEPLFEGMNWKRIGYKGGSEYGVINLSAIGITPRGDEICVVVTANGDASQPVDRIAPLFADLLRVAGTKNKK